MQPDGNRSPDTRRPTGSARGAGASPRGRALTASSNSCRLTSWTGWPISCRRRGSTGIAIKGCSPRITSSGLPSRLMTKANVGKRRDAATGGHAFDGHAAGGDTTGDRCDSCDNPPPTTPPGLRGPNSWPAWARSFRSSARGVVATSGSSRSLPSRGRSGRSWHISANRSNNRPSRPPVAHPPTGENSSRSTTTGQFFRRRPSSCPTSTSTASEAFHATVQTAREKSGFKADLLPLKRHHIQRESMTRIARP